MGKWFIEFLVFVGYTAAYTFTLGLYIPCKKLFCLRILYWPLCISSPWGASHSIFFFWVEGYVVSHTGSLRYVVYLCAWGRY